MPSMHVPLRHTGPEKAVQAALHRLGIAFDSHREDLPGTPDIVLRKLHVCIMVNGCFWHRHDCGRSRRPSTNHDYWSRKFEQNSRRDRDVELALQAQGWQVLTIWGCEINEGLGYRLRLSLDALAGDWTGAERHSRRLVTFADDFVILCKRGKAEEALLRLREIMGRLKTSPPDELRDGPRRSARFGTHATLTVVVSPAAVSGTSTSSTSSSSSRVTNTFKVIRLRLLSCRPPNKARLTFVHGAVTPCLEKIIHPPPRLRSCTATCAAHHNAGCRHHMSPTTGLSTSVGSRHTYRSSGTCVVSAYRPCSSSSSSSSQSGG